VKQNDATMKLEFPQLFLPEILLISSYPPRECGIATYSQDLVKTLQESFQQSFHIRVCALESNSEQHEYGRDVDYLLNTDHESDFESMAFRINKSDKIQMVLIQHEFGFFSGKEKRFQNFLQQISKPILLVFHTVLPGPNSQLKANLIQMAEAVQGILVMTKNSANLLCQDYDIEQSKITVIKHGTHLVPHVSKTTLKLKYGFTGKNILSTFGLLGSGKSIETTLDALPQIIKEHPETIFLVIGKTHPSVVKIEGEQYRQMLIQKVADLSLEHHVVFINRFMPLDELLEYLQLTDIYLFTSKDPNQAVSGTFSYAISCGCPIVSTNIPHAKEVLQQDTGIIIDFESSAQLANAVNMLMKDSSKRTNISNNAIHLMASSAWQNSAIAHAQLFRRYFTCQTPLFYNMPPVNLDHIWKMTTSFGMLQFSNINQPDLESGYTLDDNARAMVAICQLFELHQDRKLLPLIIRYFGFIEYCLQPKSDFLNYVDKEGEFTLQNHETNLEDSNGRAIWALGYLLSLSKLLPLELVQAADKLFNKAIVHLPNIHSTRAMAFAIKGLYYNNAQHKNEYQISLIRALANRMVQMYKHESSTNWKWFESYLTYANSILPESMLCAWLATRDDTYAIIAHDSFEFLLGNIFTGTSIHVVSNKEWIHKHQFIGIKQIGGEQPIDVAYTILALSKFHQVFPDKQYLSKMQGAFNWFLGANHLQQIIYNPCTGGCYDGLELDYVNLNQGAESTVSYLMARLCLEKSLNKYNHLLTESSVNHAIQKQNAVTVSSIKITSFVN
jgi:glycosyltransferase involved in cell wall biosynthesis